jgi:ketosteroid isomerase-like protein
VRDIAALLVVYADDAERFDHTSKPVAQGSATLRARFTIRFKNQIPTPRF